MLDVYEKIVLSFIVSECNDTYQVLEVAEIEEHCKNNIGKKHFNLKSIIKRLTDKNYVSVKYFDETKYCLCATQTGKQMFANYNTEQKKNKKIKIELTVLIFLIIFFAFLGSFLGTILCNIIFNG